MSCLAAPVMPSFTLKLTNNGDRLIYYALSTTDYHYSPNLCLIVNNATIKQEVFGSIPSGVSKNLVLQPVSDYINFCGSSWISVTFSYGLTLDGALYNQNWIYTGIRFNFSPGTNNSKPFNYQVENFSNSKDVFSDPLINHDLSQQYMINSNSADFVY